MKKTLAIIVLFLIVAGIIGALVARHIDSPANAEFTLQIAGPADVQFSGFCTHEVNYLINGSRTEATDILGTIAANEEPCTFDMVGTEISCAIENLTPEKSITVVLFKDGVEVKRIASETDKDYHFYIDWYPSDA